MFELVAFCPFSILSEYGTIWIDYSPQNKQIVFKSLKYLAEESKEIYFCGCKMSKQPPFCDGSHSKL